MKSINFVLTICLLVTCIVFHHCHGKNRYQGKTENCRRAPDGNDLGKSCDEIEEGLRKYDEEHQTEHDSDEEIIHEYNDGDDDSDDWDEDENDDDEDDDNKDNSEMTPGGGKLREDKKGGRNTDHKRHQDGSESESSNKDKENSKDKKHFQKDERKGKEKIQGRANEKNGKRTGKAKTEYEGKVSKEGKSAKFSESKREKDTIDDRSGSSNKEGKRHNGKDKRKKEKNAGHGKSKSREGKHSKHGKQASDTEVPSHETFSEETEEKYANHAELAENYDNGAIEDAILLEEASQVSGTESTENEAIVADTEGNGSLIETSKDTSTEGDELDPDENDAQEDVNISSPTSYTEAPEGMAPEHLGEVEASPGSLEVNTDKPNSDDIKAEPQTEFTTKPDDATIREFLTTTMEFDSTIMMEEHMRVGKQEEEHVLDSDSVKPEVSTDGIQEENNLGDGSVVLEASSHNENPLPEVSAEYVTSPDAETQLEGVSDDLEQQEGNAS